MGPGRRSGLAGTNSLPGNRNRHSVSDPHPFVAARRDHEPCVLRNQAQAAHFLLRRPVGPAVPCAQDGPSRKSLPCLQPCLPCCADNNFALRISKQL